MNIRRGRSFVEDASAVANEQRFSKDFEKDFILLVEGIDDIKVIENFYLMNGLEKSFRVIKANDESESETYNVAGKKNAISLYYLLVSKKRNVVCLLDRDYDFHLGDFISDNRVMYYDFYELENYLFEEHVLKIVVKNIYDYSSNEEFIDFLELFKEIEYACRPYYLLCYFREINFKYDLLSDSQLEQLLKLIKKSPSEMMQMNNLGVEDKLERIKIYIENKLSDIELSLKKIRIMIETLGHDTEKIYLDGECLYHFKYNIKGKILFNSIKIFVKYIFETYPELQAKKANGNLDSLSTRLKFEWLPYACTSLKITLQDIEQKFEHNVHTLTK